VAELRPAGGARTEQEEACARTLLPHPQRRAGLALFCPVPLTGQGLPFEVPLPPGLPVAGVILADQVRSLDHRAQQAEPIARAPEEVIRAVLARVKLLLD